MDRREVTVLKTIEDSNVKFVRLWFTDVVGTLKSIVLSPAEVADGFEEGIGFDGSSIESLARAAESDMLLKPDASTFQILPWRGKKERTARMFCDIVTPNGRPAPADPRYVLKRILKKADDMGFSVMIHPEVEYYMFESDQLGPDGQPVPIDEGGYFDHIPGGVTQDVRRKIVQTLEDLAIEVEFGHHEAGPGQNEIDLRYSGALEMADNVMTMRAVVKEIAIDEGKFASFMPKPFSFEAGSGLHTHFSLFENDHNAFYDAGAQYQLSRTARQFIAGVLHHATEFTAVTNQYVNSYRRLWGGAEAPSYVSWGQSNRSALVRVPSYKPSKSQSARVEYRGIDSAANPYLAFAVVIAAGLKGIEEKYELGEPSDEDVGAMSTQERMLMGMKPLPSSLYDSLSKMDESEFMAEVLGETVFDYFLKNKRQEWDDYRQYVTPYEYETNLPKL